MKCKILAQVSYILISISAWTGATRAADWTQFRGDSTNAAPNENPPTQWNLDDGKNVAWQADLPGRGLSGPIVVGDNVIVTASSGVKQQRLHVLCFDARSGKQRWARQFWATGRTLVHESSAVAANTPASDGKLIYAFFSSNDLVCLDLNGNLQWFRGLGYDYPSAGNDVGMASSPVVIGDTVVVQVESQGDSFAAGINTASGEDRWRLPRARFANWSSPVAQATGKIGEKLVILQSSEAISAHDANSGEQRWSHKYKCDGISSPVVHQGVVYVPGGGLRALNVSGQSQNPELLWNATNLAPGAASPVVHDGKVYIVNRAGVINCASIKDGKSLWQLRLKGPFWATPLIAGKHMYLVNQEGTVQVVSIDGAKGEEVAKNSFGESVMGSPAVSNDALYFRSNRNLWKIAATEKSLTTENTENTKLKRGQK